jgi:N-methylhydantoinase A
MRRIGVDTGGTFCDLVLVDDESGTVTVTKVPSQPKHPDRAIIAGVEQLLGLAGCRLDEIDTLSHGTTVATNAVITGHLARAGMLTSEGTRDVIEIGSQQRPVLYDLHQTAQPVLIPRDRRLDIPGRIAADGAEVEPLDEAAVRAAVARLIELEVEAIAIAGLFSFLHPEHERRVREIVREMAPEVYVVCSSDISPEIRELPRYATTAVNAVLAPVLDPYLRQLEHTLRESGLQAPLYIMQSSGGVATIEQSAGDGAHNLVLSGPAAGIIGATAIAGAAGFDRIITIDVGGTSADVSLAVNGEPRTRNEMELPGGLPLKTRNLEIEAIGTGGGSVAWVDAGGALRVGPQSAGADPGPVCYGIGGTQPTLTDAQVVLGRLNPAGLLKGALAINPEAARQAMAELGAKIGLSPERTALGVVAVANANMAGAIRLRAARHGDDLRDFALVAAGGAGPLSGASLAGDLGMQAVCIPPNPGLLCAGGLLSSNLRRDYTAPLLVLGSALRREQVRAVLDDLMARADAGLDRDGILATARAYDMSLDLRYVGQDYTVAVPITYDTAPAEAISGFHELHERVYGFAAPGEKVEVASARLVAWGLFPKLSTRPNLPAAPGRPGAHRKVWFEDGADYVETPIYDRADLAAGQQVDGPAIVEQLDTTTVVPPGWTATTDTLGVLTLRAKEQING